LVIIIEVVYGEKFSELVKKIKSNKNKNQLLVIPE